MSRPRLARQIVALLVWLALPLCPGSTIFAENPLRLRVLTYNIHHGEGTDGKLDLDRIAAIIRNARPDIVALQECDENTARTGQVDQPQVLADKTGMHMAFGANIAFQGGRYGNAVLSRFPIARSQNHLLPSLKDGEQRGALEIELDCEGRKLILIATHLDSRRDDQERLQSAEFINRRFTGEEHPPAILAGDLNATPDTRVMQAVFKHWTTATPAPQPTSPANQPRNQIDYVLFSSAHPWKVIHFEVLDQPVASDHRPLLVELQLE
jgi:endonuclease/exonuclease/phosphatase family metal-dependent hydrolase